MMCIWCDLKYGKCDFNESMHKLKKQVAFVHDGWREFDKEKPERGTGVIVQNKKGQVFFAYYDNDGVFSDIVFGPGEDIILWQPFPKARPMSKPTEEPKQLERVTEWQPADKPPLIDTYVQSGHCRSREVLVVMTNGILNRSWYFKSIRKPDGQWAGGCASNPVKYWIDLP